MWTALQTARCQENQLSYLAHLTLCRPNFVTEMHIELTNAAVYHHNRYYAQLRNVK